MNKKRIKWLLVAILVIALGSSGFALQQGVDWGALGQIAPFKPSAASPARALEPRPTPATCLDGSALTVTDEDSNQVNYRCGSGAVGAYLQRRAQ